MADFGGEVEAFRADVREWLDANFPKALAKDPMAQLAKMQAQPESETARAWRQAMGAKGCGTPTWPKEYGGGGLSAPEAKVLQEEVRSLKTEVAVAKQDSHEAGRQQGEQQSRAEITPVIERMNASIACRPSRCARRRAATGLAGVLVLLQ